VEQREDALVSLLVLLVEGDRTDERQSMRQHLVGQGCVVKTVSDPLDATSVAYADWPDLIVVNTCSDLWNVSDVCVALDRSNLDLPRLVVSDGEGGSPLRAAAHLAAPFTSRRLAYRMKKAIGTQADRFLRSGDVCVDTLKRNVKCGGQVAHLTPKELGLLCHLMRHAGCAIGRPDIMKVVWETEYCGDTRTVEVHIRWLRRKIEEDPKRPRRILTVRGTGYQFNAAE
jgi:two-component system alkaline phosphatase synthesis response regulator PhoP